MSKHLVFAYIPVFVAVFIVRVNFLLLSNAAPLQYEEGKCTYYGIELAVGSSTYCGVFHGNNSNETAHYDVPNMPCGTRLLATNLANNKSVEVTVNDKGPNGRPGFIMDLTLGAFRAIADPALGVINCSCRIIHPNPTHNTVVAHEILNNDLYAGGTGQEIIAETPYT